MRQQTLARVVGKNVGDLRRKRGWTQDELAAEARAVGLDWTASVVTAIETGRRGLTFAEALLLPVIFPVRARELLSSASGTVQIERAFVSGQRLAGLLTGDVRVDDLRTPGKTGWRRALDQMPDAIAAYEKSTRELAKLLNAAGVGDASVKDVARIEQAARQSAEMSIARRTRHPAKRIAALAFARWGHSLTEERDRLGVGRTPQARGRITRKLEAELLDDAARLRLKPTKGT